MRYIVAITTVLVLFMFGFALSQSLDDSASAAMPGGRTITIAEDLAIDPPAESITTAFLDIIDCGVFAVFADADTSLTVYLHPSVDGTIDPARMGGLKSERIAGQSVTYFPNFLGAPKVAVEFKRNDTTVTDTINKAWLFCGH